MKKTFLTPPHLRAIFDQAAVGILVADAQGTVVAINPRGAELFGYPEGELVGQLVDTLLSGPLRHLFVQHRLAYMRQPTRYLKGKGLFLQAQRKDGTLFPVDISLSHFDDGRQRWLLAFVVDQTPDERAMNQAIADSRAQGSELRDVRTRLMAMASHEFRTPLTGILSSVALLKRYTAPTHQERRAKHLLRIEEAVQQLTQLLDDLVLLPEEDDCQPVYFAPTALLGETIAEAELHARPGQKLHLTHTGQDSVYLNPDLLKKSVRRLLSNATKYSPERADIYVTSQKESDFFEIAVKDPGIGISKADLPHLGEQFFRGRNAADYPGRGLGLYAVKRYLELLQGDLLFQSTLGQGTTASLLFCHVNDPAH